MLSEAARSDSIPGLEIEADDVRCTHGATSGRVDEEQIFYAQARGLSADEAARLVVAGFSSRSSTALQLHLSERPGSSYRKPHP